MGQRSVTHLKKTFGDSIVFTDTVSHEGSHHIHLLACWILLVTLLHSFLCDAVKLHDEYASIFKGEKTNRTSLPGPVTSVDDGKIMFPIIGRWRKLFSAGIEDTIKAAGTVSSVD